MSDKDSENAESDDYDRLVIDDDRRPMLETLLIKNGPNGYTVEKSKKEKLLHVNENYMVPVSKNSPLTSEELSEIYVKHVEQSPYFANYFTSNSNSKTNYENIYQDPAVDSTNPDLEDFDEQSSKAILMEDKSEFNLPCPEQDSFSIDLLNSNLSRLSHPSSLEVSKQLFKTENDHNLETEFEFVRDESFEERQGSQSLNPIILARSLSGTYYVKKDCLIGGKTQNLSDLESFQVDSSNLESKLNNSDIYFEEPLLERLFSNVTDASEATTQTVTSSDEVDYATEMKNEKDNPVENQNSQKTIILDDGSLLVINRNDSNIITIGYD